DPQVEAVVADVGGDGGDVVVGPLAGAGEPHVGGADAQIRDELDNPELLLDAGIRHRGRLEAVAQRLVEEIDVPRRGGALPAQVPVVDQLGVVIGGQRS